MDTVAVTVPLRPPTKKMKKRKELDALAPRHAVSRRCSGKRSSQELLSESSDERSEYWNATMRARKDRHGRICPNLLRACSAFLACAVVLVTASLVWLFIDVRQQLAVLRTELDQVIAGNEGVPDALHKCHSLSRELRNNQTLVYSQIAELKVQMDNYSTQISSLQQTVVQVNQWALSAPELARLPNRLEELSKSVADFGSQIGDLHATVNMLKESKTKMQDVQNGMQENIVNLNKSLAEASKSGKDSQAPMTNETRVKTEELSAAISRLTSNLSSVNETLSSSLKWALEDHTKDHKQLNSLWDMTTNVSTTLMSLKNECDSEKSEQEKTLRTVQNLQEEVKKIQTSSVEFNSKLQELTQVHKSSKTPEASMDQIKNEQSKIESTTNDFSSVLGENAAPKRSKRQ